MVKVRFYVKEQGLKDGLSGVYSSISPIRDELTNYFSPILKDHGTRLPISQIEEEDGKQVGRVPILFGTGKDTDSFSVNCGSSICYFV